MSKGDGRLDPNEHRPTFEVGGARVQSGPGLFMQNFPCMALCAIFCDLLRLRSKRACVTARVVRKDLLSGQLSLSRLGAVSPSTLFPSSRTSLVMAETTLRMSSSLSSNIKVDSRILSPRTPTHAF